MENLQLKNDVDVNKIKNIANKNKRLFNFFELFDAKIGLDEYYSIINNLNNGNNLLCIKIQFMSGNMNYRNYTIPCLFFNNILKLTFMPLYYDLFIDMVNNLHIDYPFVFNVSKYKFNDYIISYNYIDNMIELQNGCQSIGVSVDDFYNSLTCMYRNIN